MLLCACLDDRPLADAAAAMARFPQVLENVRVTRKELPEAVLAEVERVNDELGDSGRVMVRPSGTEPLIRVLAEAEEREVAQRTCGSIAALVRRELG